MLIVPVLIVWNGPCQIGVNKFARVRGANVTGLGVSRYEAYAFCWERDPPLKAGEGHFTRLLIGSRHHLVTVGHSIARIQYDLITCLKATDNFGGVVIATAQLDEGLPCPAATNDKHCP